MRPRVIISPKARRDLIAIGRYTEKQWGNTQRKKYLEQLRTRFEKLAQHPSSGRRRDELPEAPWGYHEGRHVIFYRPLADGIEIVRILHDSMDFSRHLV